MDVQVPAVIHILDEQLLNNDQIIKEATERFQKARDWESTFRANFRYDKAFEASDFSNGFMWDAFWRNGNGVDRTRLTINKVRQNVLQITNDQLRNKQQIKYDPVGDGATHEASEVLEGMVRHIWYESNADDAIATAFKSMVIGGYGVWRVNVAYESDTSFDQIITIERIPDCMNVYIDPDIVELDGSDMRWGVVVSDISRDEFNKRYPKWKDKISGRSVFSEANPDQTGFPSLDNSKVRLGEYFRRVERSETLYLLRDGTTVFESEAKDIGMDAKTLKKQTVKSREVLTQNVEWYLIADDEVIETRAWDGKYIPLVPIVANQTIVEGVMDRCGHVRHLVDSQRQYSVGVSAAVVALQNQTKVAWLISKQSIEGSEVQWKMSNINNYAFMTWDEWGDDGQEKPNSKPERIDPPQWSQGYQAQIEQAATDIMAASGQFQASFGEQSNERSGRAINERQRQGDNATYHFVDALSVGIRYTGKIILDLIPHIYDTERSLQVLGEDGKRTTVNIDPSMDTAHSEMKPDDFDWTPMQVKMALNPNVGRYMVQADVGPSYGTRRQETFNAISQIIQEVPQLTNVIGDLLFRSMDVPLADEIADRMRNIVSPQALGQGPTPTEQQQQQVLAQQHMIIQKLSQENQDLKQKTALELMQKDIDVYKAVTDREKVYGTIDPEALKLKIRETLSQMFGASANALIHEHALETAISQTIVGQVTPESVGMPQQAPQQAPQQGTPQQ